MDLPQDASQPANADSGSNQQRDLTAFPVQHGNLSEHVGTPCAGTHTHARTCTGVSGSSFRLQIHVGAADHRSFILHAASQLQRRPGALPSLHVPYNDPTQQLHHQPVPLSLPHPAPGLPALPAAAAAPTVLSGKSAVCCAATKQSSNF